MPTSQRAIVVLVVCNFLAISSCVSFRTSRRLFIPLTSMTLCNIWHKRLQAQNGGYLLITRPAFVRLRPFNSQRLHRVRHHEQNQKTDDW